MYAFIKALFIGLSVAAPLGPIGVICIQNTLNKGKRYGVASGLGAASADGVYGIIAALGITVVFNFLKDYSFYIEIFGIIFLIWIAYDIFNKKIDRYDLEKDKGSGLFISYAKTFLLTLSNPMTILFFLGIFAGIGVDSNSYISSLTVSLGIFSGSLLWWFLLSFTVAFFKKKIGYNLMKTINIISSVMIGMFIIYKILDLIKRQL